MPTIKPDHPWSDKGLGVCARKAERHATHHADAKFPRRDAKWQREFFHQFGVEFFRLTRPDGHGKA